MNAIQGRSLIANRALPWLLLLCLPVLAFLFFTVSVGIALVATFTVVLGVVVTASVVLIRSKLAFQRQERDLLSGGRAR